MADQSKLEPIVRLLYKAYRNRNSPVLPWPLASYPLRGVVHLMIDGWMSSGGTEESEKQSQHLAVMHVQQARDTDANFPVAVRAFSFGDLGMTYAGYDTCDDLITLIEKLVGILDEPAPERRWLVTAYSLGAVIAALAIGQLSQGSREMGRRIPAFTLLHPALHGAPELIGAVMDEKSPFKGEEPLLLRQLGGGGQEWFEQAQMSIGWVVDSGVGVTVIHSRHDTVAPFKTLGDSRVFEFHTPDDLLEDRPGRSPDDTYAHFRVRGNRFYHRLIYAMAKPLVSMEREWVETMPSPPSGAATMSDGDSS